MAVARVTASPKWLTDAALAVADAPKAHRELMRAVDRPGRSAELDADEVRLLAERRPEDPTAQRLLRDIEASEERDRARRQAERIRRSDRGR